jgi:hypothetical protein
VLEKRSNHPNMRNLSIDGGHLFLGARHLRLTVSNYFLSIACKAP